MGAIMLGFNDYRLLHRLTMRIFHENKETFECRFAMNMAFKLITLAESMGLKLVSDYVESDISMLRDGVNEISFSFIYKDEKARDDFLSQIPKP